MKKDKKKTFMILALVSIVICGCPGCYLMIPGISSLIDATGGSIDSFEDLLSDLGEGFVLGGWKLCLGGIFVLVPFVLAFIAVLIRNQDQGLEKLEPTGASEDEPIPPTN